MEKSWNTFLLDASDTKSLLVFRVKLGGKNFDDHIGKLLLGINVGIEIRLSGFNGSHDGFKGMATLFHVTLDLPVELDFIRDVKVESKVKEITDTIVVHGVKTLKDDDRSRFNIFGCVKSSIDVVVNWLLDSLSILESLDLFIHEVEVVLSGVKSSQSCLLTSIAVV